MTKLDDIALNIELVLISIIEAVALTSLAENAVDVFRSPEWFQYLPYVLAGLTFLLVFWSQAILHAISFIRWPLRMEHMFLYFVAAFVQVVAYSNIEDLPRWFLWWSIFSLIALLIYVIDLRIIKDMAPVFARVEGGAEYVHEVERRHMREMKILVPIALAFNAAAFLAAFFMPSLFANPLAYATLGALQLLISLGALVDCVRNFRERSAMLPALFH